MAFLRERGLVGRDGNVRASFRLNSTLGLLERGVKPIESFAGPTLHLDILEVLEIDAIDTHWER